MSKLLLVVFAIVISSSAWAQRPLPLTGNPNADYPRLDRMNPHEIRDLLNASSTALPELQNYFHMLAEAHRLQYRIPWEAAPTTVRAPNGAPLHDTRPPLQGLPVPEIVKLLESGEVVKH
jgi:hypothetical protein